MELHMRSSYLYFRPDHTDLSIVRRKMMFKCSLISCMLAFAMAQTPTRPVFPETFYASGEVELHVAEETRFGKCESRTYSVNLYFNSFFYQQSNWHVIKRN